jgi:hypothetical protein
MKVLLTFFMLGSAAWAAFGRDAWVIRVAGESGARSNRARHIWFDEIRIHNAGAAIEPFRVVEASNGVTFPVVDPLPIPPSRTILPDLEGLSFEVPMSVFHLDVGDDVIVSSRLALLIPPDITTPPPTPVLGAVPLPVFRELFPAGTEEILLEADLEDLPSSVNLALFNAGSVEAHALVEVMSACDDRIVASETIAVPANFIGLFPLGSPVSCNAATPGFPGPTYLRVTLDQPGFAVAAVGANGPNPEIDVAISAPAR